VHEFSDFDSKGGIMKKSVVLVLAVLVIGVALALAADITGTWEMTTIMQRGGQQTERKQDVTFKQEGEKLTVSWMQQGRGGGEPVEIKGEGTIKGNDFEWKITRTTPRGEMTTLYKGTVVDATHLKGTQTMNMGGQDMTSEWTAVKK
jgi:hypothetical protein